MDGRRSFVVVFVSIFATICFSEALANVRQLDLLIQQSSAEQAITAKKMRLKSMELPNDQLNFHAKLSPGTQVKLVKLSKVR